jgi:hypothetical protein
VLGNEQKYALSIDVRHDFEKLISQKLKIRKFDL